MSPDSRSLLVSLAELDAEDRYRQLFTDAGFWEPYVRLVCKRHGLGPCCTVRSGLPGTCPTFIADKRWVVKFFGRLFDGGLGFQTELEVGRLLAGADVMPAPAILASGRLCAECPLQGKDPDPSDWPWPYLIFEYIPGISIGEVYGQVSLDDKLRLARELGAMTRRLHELPLTGSSMFRPDWGGYLSLFQEQWVRCADHLRAENALPAHLASQVEAYTLPPERLIDLSTRPFLIHADLTRDHVLGRLDEDRGTSPSGGWTTLAVIDFGDAMVGDLLYELVALHLDLFGCDKRLLGAYLDAYGLDEAMKQSLPARAMSAVLLHRFNAPCLRYIFESHPRSRDVATLNQLAALIWDLDTPGLEE